MIYIPFNLLTNNFDHIIKNYYHIFLTKYTRRCVFLGRNFEWDAKKTPHCRSVSGSSVLSFFSRRCFKTYKHKKKSNTKNLATSNTKPTNTKKFTSLKSQFNSSGFHEFKHKYKKKSSRISSITAARWSWWLPLTLVHVREGTWRGSMEEFEGRRKEMLTTREWCHPVGYMLHHV